MNWRHHYPTGWQQVVLCLTLPLSQYRNTGANDSFSAGEPEKVELSDVLKLAKQIRYPPPPTPPLVFVRSVVSKEELSCEATEVTVSAFPLKDLTHTPYV